MQAKVAESSRWIPHKPSQQFKGLCDFSDKAALTGAQRLGSNF